MHTQDLLTILLHATTSTSSAHTLLSIGIHIKPPSPLSKSPCGILKQHPLPLFDIHGLVEDDLFEILLLNDLYWFLA
jgi:hypothetical protein